MMINLTSRRAFIFYFSTSCLCPVQRGQPDSNRLMRDTWWACGFVSAEPVPAGFLTVDHISAGSLLLPWVFLRFSSGFALVLDFVSWIPAACSLFSLRFQKCIVSLWWIVDPASLSSEPPGCCPAVETDLFHMWIFNTLFRVFLIKVRLWAFIFIQYLSIQLEQEVNLCDSNSSVPLNCFP